MKLTITHYEATSIVSRLHNIPVSNIEIQSTSGPINNDGVVGLCNMTIHDKIVGIKELRAAIPGLGLYPAKLIVEALMESKKT